MADDSNNWELIFNGDLRPYNALYLAAESAWQCGYKAVAFKGVVYDLSHDLGRVQYSERSSLTVTAEVTSSRAAES
jgi:hypothetical protein